MVASCIEGQERHLVTHLQIQSMRLGGWHLRELWGKQYSEEIAIFQLGHGGEWNPHKERINIKKKRINIEVMLRTMNDKSKS